MKIYRTALLPVTLNHTYFAEVLADMHSWCESNCQGDFKIDIKNGNGIASFEVTDDYIAFAGKWSIPIPNQETGNVDK